jgi:hypothetical protein
MFSFTSSPSFSRSSFALVVLFLFCFVSFLFGEAETTGAASIRGLTNKGYIFHEGGVITTTNSKNSKLKGSYYLKKGDFIDTKVELVSILFSSLSFLHFSFLRASYSLYQISFFPLFFSFFFWQDFFLFFFFSRSDPTVV